MKCENCGRIAGPLCCNACIGRAEAETPLCDCGHPVQSRADAGYVQSNLPVEMHYRYRLCCRRCEEDMIRPEPTFPRHYPFSVDAPVVVE